jgi:hypothetical protein
MKKGIPQEIVSKDINLASTEAATSVLEVKCRPDIQGWIKSIENNQNPDQFYTVQINSFEDLQKRVE